MTHEQELFIQILADHLNNNKTIINVPSINWDTIIEYAKSHQVSGIVYSQVKDYLPHDTFVDLNKEMLSLFYLQMNRENDLKEIKDSFVEHQIPFFLIKGATVANLYPIPLLRTMGDTDIVVHANDRDKCHNLLLQLGFDCVSKIWNREWQYYKKDMEYELHDRLVYDEAVNKKGQAEFFNECWEHVNNEALDWSFHMLFLLFHLAKHFMNSGVGFRQFIDLAVVAQKKQINWEWVKEKLNELQLLAFAQKCFELIGRWFGISTPLAESIDDTFFETATKQVFENGIFGHYNKNATIANEVRNTSFPHLKMLQTLIGKVFPSADALLVNQQYVYLKRTNILLPFAWIHRWIRAVRRHRVFTIVRMIGNSFTSNEQINIRKNQLEQWGL